VSILDIIPAASFVASIVLLFFWMNRKVNGQ